MQVGALCDCCNNETPQDCLELRYVAVKKRFLNICKECRDKYVTYLPSEWNGNESDGEIPASIN